VAGFVLDCSVAIAWCFDDEATPALDTLLEHAAEVGAIVPPLWHLEVTNVLLQGERRGRIPDGGANQRLELLDALPIESDLGGEGPAWRSAVLAVARTERLTAYDAAYLELAERLTLPLATSDNALRKAATRRNVVTIP
jgi:predicted nucleic acid-binding protein